MHNPVRKRTDLAWIELALPSSNSSKSGIIVNVYIHRWATSTLICLTIGPLTLFYDCIQGGKLEHRFNRVAVYPEPLTMQAKAALSISEGGERGQMDINDDIPFYSDDQILFREIEEERRRADEMESEVNRLETLVRELERDARKSEEFHADCMHLFERMISETENGKDLTKSLAFARDLAARLRKLIGDDEIDDDEQLK